MRYALHLTITGTIAVEIHEAKRLESCHHARAKLGYICLYDISSKNLGLFEYFFVNFCLSQWMKNQSRNARMGKARLWIKWRNIKSLQPD